MNSCIIKSDPIKFIVFDRDGTLVKHIPYLCDPDKVELLPGVKEGINNLKQKGNRLFLHTNQSGVARGYFDIKAVELCNQRMIDLIGLGPDVFDEICIATDFPPGPVSFRKPSPSFGLSLIEKYGINLVDLFYVGDSIVDIETARSLRCTAFGVNTGELDLQLMLEGRDDLQATVYPNLTELILSNFNY
jgi:D-glycero-D-manno-heptose 1,7-bisphosphate phosphatase